MEINWTSREKYIYIYIYLICFRFCIDNNENWLYLQIIQEIKKILQEQLDFSQDFEFLTVRSNIKKVF